MKLKTVECSEYKSIRMSNPFEVGDVTCLVGKNESGKTVLLEALYRLNPIVPEDGRFDVTNDYPRVDVTDYEQAIQAKQQQPATVVEATFVLEDGELDAIEGSFGKGVLREPLLVLWKGYDNELRYSLNLDEHEAVKTLLAKAQVPSEVAEEASTRATLAELAAFLHAKSEAQAKAVADAQNAASTLAEELKPKALDDAAKLAESQAAQKLRARLVEINQKGLSEHLWQTVLKDAIPQFLYFDEYYQMDGCVNIQQLCQRRDASQLRTF